MSTYLRLYVTEQHFPNYTNKKEHNKAIIGIYKGSKILLLRTVVISFLALSLQYPTSSSIELFIHCMGIFQDYANISLGNCLKITKT